MKTEITLKQYLAAGNSQESLAKHLGVSQGAVHQMNKSDRDIRLIIGGKKITAYEVSPVPKNRKSTAA
jgi:predicted transcriptional regulator